MSTPRSLSDRYELGETLGFGGMSEVHGGRDLRLDRDVAIKVLRADLARDPSFYLRFRREAQNAAALNHPAIVAVYDTGEADTSEGPLPYIVMELVDGQTLRDVVRNDGPLSPRRAMEVVGDVCAALDFSHRNGIVHRDVKPANVMINRAGSVKVMDFGIARAIADGASTMTQTAAVIGTAQYLSPEQARGEQVDARSDVYSTGCVLYELITGEPPFIGDSPVAVAYQHVREDPRPPSQLDAGVPATLDSIVLKAMSKNPANRYQTAGEMRTDLVRVLAGQRPLAPAIMTDDERSRFIGAPVPGRHHDEHLLSGSSADGPEPRGRRAGLYALLAVLGLALVGLVGVFLYSVNGGGAPTKVAVPELVSQESTVAQAELTRLGLVVELVEVPDPTVAEGFVVSAAPSAGTSVELQTVVTLRVSSGPEQAEVPDLRRMTLTEATAALSEARLTVEPGERRRTVSSVQELDRVVDQDPAAGEQVDTASGVTLTLGGGPERVNVDTVVGLDVDVATANLTNGDAFRVTVSSKDSSAPAGQVLAQRPEGGQEAVEGSTVDLVVSNGNRVVMPDMVGSDRVQALTLLRASGWTGGGANLVITPVTAADPTQGGLVLAQSPAAGTDIELNQRLGVDVGQAAPPQGALSTSPVPDPTISTTPTSTGPTSTPSGG